VRLDHLLSKERTPALPGLETQAGADARSWPRSQAYVLRVAELISGALVIRIAELGSAGSTAHLPGVRSGVWWEWEAGRLGGVVRAHCWVLRKRAVASRSGLAVWLIVGRGGVGRLFLC
jgi:sirohydrochlorin ferrochelatase